MASGKCWRQDNGACASFLFISQATYYWAEATYSTVDCKIKIQNTKNFLQTSFQRTNHGFGGYVLVFVAGSLQYKIALIFCPHWWTVSTLATLQATTNYSCRWVSFNEMEMVLKLDDNSFKNPGQVTYIKGWYRKIRCRIGEKNSPSTHFKNYSNHIRQVVRSNVTVYALMGMCWFMSTLHKARNSYIYIQEWIKLQSEH